MKTSNLITALALGAVAYGIPAAEDPANRELVPADIQSAADHVNVEERGLAPATIAGPTFHPAWLPRVRPAAQAITIAGHALLMTAWIDAQNRICIILDAAFPGFHGTIIAGVQNLHNNLAVLPHVFELGKTYVAPDNQAEIQPGDTWRWFWFK
ncbi:unnamed protein product [Colletotrichum noveboracense]|uniref:Uncharacterized protein n=1 Tax=Colletotrichum noveboracense TaxID=2664923 RepID=A0A9W4WDE1_9PEZI|nr:hypothetical protein COL940_007880 [Colletotrichum noveboracense]CAI0652047.1 unnamed protein product [Colletotrichum noveboracense]